MLIITDSIGPFFAPLSIDDRVLNWSKAPFFELETECRLTEDVHNKITESFLKYANIIRQQGFNAISLDDLPHMVFAIPQSKADFYRKLYQNIITTCRRLDLRIFINCDLFSIERDRKKNDFASLLDSFAHDIEKAFDLYDVDGIITRFGEADGLDVKGDYKSILGVRTTSEANRLLQRVIPIFEQQKKQLIFRTWSVGAYPIGDLCWNRQTYREVFHRIESKNLIISIKYGESDFYDYGAEPLNHLFFEGKQQKLLEFQVRREREGFGELPFICSDTYARYLNQAHDNPHFVGISMWLQTGGWGKANTLTFLKNSSRYVELNSQILLDCLRNKNDFGQAYQAMAPNHADRRFLMLYSELLLKAIYGSKNRIEPRYFRRSRIPPQMWLNWQEVTINQLIADIHQSLFVVGDFVTPSEMEELNTLAAECSLPNTDFAVAVLQMLAAARKCVFGRGDAADHQIIKTFQGKHPNTFTITVERIKPVSESKKYFIQTITRKTHTYRLIDKTLLSAPVLRIICKLYLSRLLSHSPSFINKQAMDIRLLLTT